MATFLLMTGAGELIERVELPECWHPVSVARARCPDEKVEERGFRGGVCHTAVVYGADGFAKLFVKQIGGK